MSLRLLAPAVLKFCLSLLAVSGFALASANVANAGTRLKMTAVVEENYGFPINVGDTVTFEYDVTVIPNSSGGSAENMTAHIGGQEYPVLGSGFWGADWDGQFNETCQFVIQVGDGVTSFFYGEGVVDDRLCEPN